jgi:iron(III) transport system ATP-binding protein
VSEVKFEKVSKRYGEDPQTPWAVDAIDLVIPKGTLTTLLGPSGCGKTTTLRMMAGLELPNAGKISINGQDVTRLNPAQRQVGMMFQSYALFPHLDVLGNVMYGLRMAGIDASSAKQRAMQSLEQVGLSSLEGRWPSELSGGQQQRVALARALVVEPSVLLFDEPLSNLDARLRREMRDEIRNLQQRLGLTVAYVTHDQSEAMAVSDHIVVMNHGRIQQHGTPRQLYEEPINAFIAGFMGEAILFSGVVENDGLLIQVGSLRWALEKPMVAGKVQVAIRPQAWKWMDQNHLDPAEEYLGIGQQFTSLVANVCKLAYLGNAYEVTVRSDIGEFWFPCESYGRLPQVGETIQLAICAHGVNVLADKG